MRKSFDALSGLVRNELDRDPASGEVYVFVNRSRSCIKLLHWESGCFVLYYKRLEKGTFTVSIQNAGGKWCIEVAQAGADDRRNSGKKQYTKRAFAMIEAVFVVS